MHGTPIINTTTTPGRGIPKLPVIVEKQSPRASTASERERHKRLTKIPPEHIRAALGHNRDELEKDFGSEQPTPVTMMIAVRSELKSDIEDLKDNDKIADARLDSMNETLIKNTAAVEGLSKAVDKANSFSDKMLEMVRDELQSKRGIDEKIKITESELTRHREFSKTEADMLALQAKVADQSFVIRAKWRNIGKIVAWATAGGGVVALLGLIFKQCVS